MCDNGIEYGLVKNWEKAQDWLHQSIALLNENKLVFPVEDFKPLELDSLVLIKITSRRLLNSPAGRWICWAILRSITSGIAPYG